MQERNGKPAESRTHKEKLPLPFIVINTNSATDINCEVPIQPCLHSRMTPMLICCFVFCAAQMTDDRSSVYFNYSDTFSIHDDTVVLKHIGLHDGTSCTRRRSVSQRC